MTALPLGKAERRRQGQSGVALLAFGPLLEIAEALAEEFDASVVNMRFIKPLDETLVLEIATEHDVIVTLEENAIMGGAGSAVSECLAAHGIAKVVRHIGLPDRYIDQGSREQVLAAAGLDVDSVRQRLQQWTHNVVTGSGTE
jgi:1-deoxy-D-xylulose-5-phosphate synthase